MGKGMPVRPGASRCGLARALSKLGYCSRSAARRLILEGRVRVGGRVILDPEFPTRPGGELIEVDRAGVRGEAPVYVMLNKPRGLVTTSSDERGRDTVYACFEGAGLPRMLAVGRLDMASEGLLLFTNDTAWAARLTDPGAHVDKVYHVQIGAVATPELLRGLVEGRRVDADWLAVKRVSVLRSGGRTSWLEVVLDEGRNRHLRRLMEAFGVEVLRLVRVSVGGLALGDLPKGTWRRLAPGEVRSLRTAGVPRSKDGGASGRGGGVVPGSGKGRR